MASDIAEIESKHWTVADQLRANSGLKPPEYLRPVLRLLFLRYADQRFTPAELDLYRSQQLTDPVSQRRIPIERRAYRRDAGGTLARFRMRLKRTTDINRGGPEPASYLVEWNSLLPEGPRRDLC